MYMIAEVSQYVAVASFTEAWIEISAHPHLIQGSQSPPSRRRGLKLQNSLILPLRLVASFTEAWIEILEHIGNIADDDDGRLLHGGVD